MKENLEDQICFLITEIMDAAQNYSKPVVYLSMLQLTKVMVDDLPDEELSTLLQARIESIILVQLSQN